MARSLYQTLIRSCHPALFAPKSSPSTCNHATRLVSLRTQSSQSSENSQRLLDPNDTEQREALALLKIEDAIHSIIVRRSAPDWIPFVPGSSYWVPPRSTSSYGIAQLVDKLANNLTGEEVMSLATARGWPSSAYFVNGQSPDQAEVEASSKKIESEDDG